jgi:hypothetical protein
MPRMGKRPPSYGLHKSTGQAVVYRTGDKPLYLGKRCSPESHARYEQFLAERRAEQHSPAPAAGSSAAAGSPGTVSEASPSSSTTPRRTTSIRWASRRKN